MSRVGWVASNSASVASTTAKKTVLQVLAASNHRAMLTVLRIGFEGQVNTDKPILVQIIRQTSAGTPGGVVTPVKKRSSDSETLQITADEDFSAEPTGTEVVFQQTIHPQGNYTEQFAWGLEQEVVGSEYMGVAVTAAVSVGLWAELEGEE